MALPRIFRHLHAGIKLKKILCRLRRQQSSDRHCALLEVLPVEILLLITSQLPPASRLLVSQTCHAVRNIVGSNARLSREQQFEYLAGCARSLPQKWVCEVCIRLHDVSPLDTPHQPWHMTCPRGWEAWCKEAYCPQRCRLDTRLYAIDHRHVQLTLKYSRLQEPQYYANLQNLLKPYYREDFGTHTDQQPNEVPAQYSAIPRVARDSSGIHKYLLLSTWTYRKAKDDIPISASVIGHLMICPHQDFKSDYYPYRGINCHPAMIFGSAIFDAFDNDIDEEVLGACPRCPTDFSVKGTSKLAIIRVWQDFGPGNSPLDPAWRIHAFDFRRDFGGLNCGIAGPTVHHESGSVRKLYDGSLGRASAA